MSASAILKAARRAGLTLQAKPGGKLSLRGPADVVELFRPAVAEAKPAIIEELRRQEQAHASNILQARADARNRTAQNAGLTDRWCRCGNMAELAYPIDGKREVWRCFRCAPPKGSA